MAGWHAVVASASPHTGYPAEPFVARTLRASRNEALPWIVAFTTWTTVLVWMLTEPDQRWTRCVTAAGAAASLAGAGVWAYLGRRQGCEGGIKARGLATLRLATETVTALLSFVMPAFVILQLFVVGEMRHDPLSPSVLLVLGSLLFLSAAVAYAMSTAHPKIGIGFGIAFSLLLLMLVLAQTRSVAAIPHVVVRKLHLGNIEFARIGVTASGCRQINAALGATVCAEAASAEAVTPLCPVRIRSRIGQQLVLEFGEVSWREDARNEQWNAWWGEAEPRMRRVILEKTQMPSWQPLPTAITKSALLLEAKNMTAAGSADITVWRTTAGSVDARLKRLCDARVAPLTGPAASVSVPQPPVSAPAPTSVLLPPRAARG